MATTKETSPTAAPPTAGALGLWACTALVIGNMVGSGIFLLPSALAAYGPISILGWVATSAGAIVLALIFGRLARRVPKTGGPYAYSREGFGEFAGFLIAWGYWIALWSGNAAVAVSFTSYFGVFVPAVAENSLLGLITALTLIWTLTWINIRGVEEAGTVQVVTTVLKMVPLFLIAVVGAFFLEPDRFTPFNPSGETAAAAIAACAALTLWAFIGLESATVPAGDVDRPEVTIPRATVLGTVVAAVVYIAVTAVAIGTVASEDLARSTAPLADVAAVMIGEAGAYFVAFAACVAALGTLNGFTMLSGQVPLGAARDGLFPKLFQHMTKQGTPSYGLIISNLLASGLVAMNFSKGLVDQFTAIILLATLATLFPYLICALAEVMIVIREGVDKARSDLPQILTLAALGTLYSFWAIYGSGAETVYLGFLLLVAGIPVFVWIKWRASRSDGQPSLVMGGKTG